LYVRRACPGFFFSTTANRAYYDYLTAKAETKAAALSNALDAINATIDTAIAQKQAEGGDMSALTGLKMQMDGALSGAGQGAGDATYRAYLDMLDKVEAARESGMTAREFAQSQGVPSTLTDAEAAYLDKHNIRMKAEAAGKSMADSLSALLKLPANIQAQANVEAARQTYYDYLTASPKAKAAAYDNAATLLSESVTASLETAELDAGARRALDGILGEIDNPGVTGDNWGGSNPKNRSDYRGTFFSVNPELRGKVVVHHSIEQQVLRRPETAGLFTDEEIHSYENLRGIPNKISSELHLSHIRKEWNRFYKENPNPIKEQVIRKRLEIDRIYGHLFNPKLY
jgi:hypothetical protein